MKKNELNARVFKRTSKYLILLWDKRSGKMFSETEILIEKLNSESNLDKEESSIIYPISFSSKLPEDLPNLSQKLDLSKTFVCVINQEESNIDPNEEYIFNISYGNCTIPIQIYGCDSLPPNEKDDGSKNIHIYDWNTKEKIWRKVSLERIEDLLIEIRNLLKSKKG